MPRKAFLLLPATALALSACGQQKLALAQDPIERAATCGVVAAAQARSATTNIRAPLSLDAQGQIMHPALVTAVEGDRFSVTRAAEVINKMPEVEGKVTSGKFETLAAPCDQAFPEPSGAGPVALPDDAFTARVGCYELGGFMNRALLESGDAYAAKLTDYGAMRRELDPKIGAALSQRGVSSRGDQAKALREEAMATMVKLGSPTKVLDACLDRFGPDRTT